MRVFISFALLLLWSAISSLAAAATPLNVYGVWLTDSGNSKIEIADCGDQTPCGSIIWIDDPAPERLRDTENPDAALRDRPLMALIILNGFTAKKNQWKKGKIYDPETGKTYGSKLRRREDGTLEVKGCIGPICQTKIWTLAE